MLRQTAAGEDSESSETDHVETVLDGRYSCRGELLNRISYRADRSKFLPVNPALLGEYDSTR